MRPVSMIRQATGEAGVKRLEELNAQMQAADEEENARNAELNREFHLTVYEYAHSPLLMSLMRLLWASRHGGPRVMRTHGPRRQAPVSNCSYA